MTLPIWTTNPYTALSTSEIEGEFGGTTPTSLSEYYRNGTSGYVTGDRVGFPGGVSTPIPVFGNPLAIGNFYGASAVSYTITTNKTAYNEGETMSISVTAPAADGSTLYWTIEDVTTNITISPTTLPTGIKGGYSNEPYQPVQLTASGGTAPYTFSIIVGSLPPGFTLSSGGSLSGTPTSAGVTTFTVQAIDSQGNGGVREYSLSVANVTYSPTSLPNGTQGTAYSQQLSVSGGTSPYIYRALGSLPSGLNLSTSGLISGTPTTNGTFNASIRASFNNGSLSDPGITLYYANWVISPVAAVTITVSPSSLPTGTINTSYSQQLSASGGTSPYTYSTSSPLPAGVTLSSSGLLSGTPTQSGDYSLTIQVTDSASNSINVQRTLSVGSVNITISPSSLPSATQNTAFSQQLSASGGTGPYTYSATGSLPSGISLTSGGLLSGTPTASGTFSIGIVATDANSNTGSTTYSLVIAAPAVPDYDLYRDSSIWLGNPPQYLNTSPTQSVWADVTVRAEFYYSGVTPYDVTVNFVLSGDIVASDIVEMYHYDFTDNQNIQMTPSLTGTLIAKSWTATEKLVVMRVRIIRKPSMPFRTVSVTLNTTSQSGTPINFTDSVTIRDDGWQ